MQSFSKEVIGVNKHQTFYRTITETRHEDRDHREKEKKKAPTCFTNTKSYEVGRTAEKMKTTWLYGLKKQCKNP